MKTQKFTNRKSTSEKVENSKIVNRFTKPLLRLVLLCISLGLAGTMYGSELLELKDGYSVITLSGGKIAVVSPPPVSVIYTYNLPGDHICKPLVMENSPMAVALGLFVIPTTGGNVALFSSSGLLATYNLPGDHIGRIVEFKNGNGFGVQTTGGLFSFFDVAGNFLGTINLPGEHAFGPYNHPKALFGSRIVVSNQNGEVYVLEIDGATGLPVVVSSINYPGSPAAYENGFYINQNMQCFGNGVLLANMPGAFAVMGGGMVINQNNQIFNLNNPLAPPLNLPGAPAAQPLPLKNGNVLNINQNFQIVNMNRNGGVGGAPAKIGQALNFPGAPFIPLDTNGRKVADLLIIAGGDNEGKLLAVNQNGQIWIVNPGDSVNGPSIHGGPINLPNSPLYVVRNGIKGVYVVATTGGQVFIVDARGSGGPQILASYNYAGEHTGEPKMDSTATGDHFARISTTSGLYEIDKSDFSDTLVDEEEMDGQLVCCCAMQIDGMPIAGQPVQASCDLSSMGVLQGNHASMQVVNSNSGEVVFMGESFAAPFNIDFFIPEFAQVGESYTLTTTIFDFDGQTVVFAAGTLTVISPIKIEAAGNIEAMLGELVFPTFEITNLGLDMAMLSLEVSNELSWPVEPPFMEVPLAPGESFMAIFESFVPEYEMPLTNRFTLIAFNLMNPDQFGSDYLDITVVGEEQIIFMFEGWNGISGYLDPSNPNLEEMCAPIVEDLVIMQNFYGVYWPELEINTLVNWNPLDGYLVKTSADLQLSIPGAALPVQELQLEEGWSLIPMLSNIAGFAMDIFANPEIMVAKEVAGNRVFWPVQNIYTLTTLNPGSAYFVYCIAPTSINFGLKSTATSGSDPVSQNPGFAPWETVVPTPGSHLIVIPEVLFGTFEEGDVVGAFNSSGLNCGYATISAKDMVLAVYGDDPTTNVIDGMQEGEDIIYKIYRHASAEEQIIAPDFALDMPNTGSQFVNHGLSKMAIATSVAMDEVSFSFDVYPNPASEFIVISQAQEDMQNLRIQMITMTGNVVIDIFEDKKTSDKIDVSMLPEGFYLLRISNNEQSKSTKIVIRK